jgi:hypothetical protein
MSSYDIDTFFPLKGTCFHCGRDERYDTFDNIIHRFSSGESIGVLASEYNVPHQAIELVIAHNSGAPLGLAFAVSSRARATVA